MLWMSFLHHHSKITDSSDDVAKVKNCPSIEPSPFPAWHGSANIWRGRIHTFGPQSKQSPKNPKMGTMLASWDRKASFGTQKTPAGGPAAKGRQARGGKSPTRPDPLPPGEVVMPKHLMQTQVDHFLGQGEEHPLLLAIPKEQIQPTHSHRRVAGEAFSFVRLMRTSVGGSVNSEPHVMYVVLLAWRQGWAGAPQPNPPPTPLGNWFPRVWAREKNVDTL